MDQPDQAQPHRYSFERLVEEYADRIFNVALRITGDRRDAEDAVQEAFLNAFRSWAHFRGESNPRTWLYRIAVNTALMRVRSRPPVTYLSSLGDQDDDRDWSTSLTDLDRRIDLQELVLEGLQQLQPDLRAALVLRDVDGLSTSEAADALGLTETALKSRLHRARLQLRHYLASYFRGQ
jgi:RNA polymerase sigma-70 factor (ECF subfamily)